MSTNVSTTFISCPGDASKTLGIKLPFLVMLIKNLKKYFSFEVQVLDDKNVRRRFRASNYQVCCNCLAQLCCPMLEVPTSVCDVKIHCNNSIVCASRLSMYLVCQHGMGLIEHLTCRCLLASSQCAHVS
jgi:hypothetical protein